MSCISVPPAMLPSDRQTQTGLPAHTSGDAKFEKLHKCTVELCVYKPYEGVN